PTQCAGVSSSSVSLRPGSQTKVGLRPTPRLGRLRGPLRHAPLPRGRAVRAAVQLDLDLPRALPDAADLATELLGQSYKHISDGRVLSGLDVTMALADGASQCCERQWGRRVRVPVAHPAAIENQRVVEERAVPVWCGAHLLNELGKVADVIDVQLRVLGNLLRFFAVM